EFGPERLKLFIAEHKALPAQALCDALVERLSEWQGNGREPHDDVTVVVVDFHQEASNANSITNPSECGAAAI
ncbi:MAG TPA: SpoIIE family protein phosphatase, partial [Candidatus Angelobacter sp.]|nr:SpoIIE family protein phosphatase [Candidatus Angelobacter sp.]